MKSVIGSLPGTWSLQEIFYRDKLGKQIHMYGANPVGILMYDSNGYMNAQLGYSYDTGKGKLGEEEGIGADEMYMAYFGRYYEKSPGCVIHQVEGSTNYQWIGTDQIRFVTPHKEQLFISTPQMELMGISTKIEVVWNRVCRKDKLV